VLRNGLLIEDQPRVHSQILQVDMSLASLEWGMALEHDVLTITKFIPIGHLQAAYRNNGMPKLELFPYRCYALHMTDALHTYTDGSFDAANSSGGWAFVVYEGDRPLYAACGKEAGTSNNTFEVLAVLNAVAWIAAEVPARSVTLWTDAAHVIEGCRRWRAIWRTNGWKRITRNSHARRRSIPDMEIWRQLDGLLERHPQVVVEWCKGHSGAGGNELADILARNAARSAVT
jgi:ribonuclease HI